MKKLILITGLLPIFTNSVFACNDCLKKFILEDIKDTQEIMEVCENLSESLGFKEYHYYLEGRLETYIEILERLNFPCDFEIDSV